MSRCFQHELSRSPEQVLDVVREAAELWGARWQQLDGGRGRLMLPVVQGLRQGIVVGEIRVEPAAGGSELSLEVESSRYHLNRSAVAILILGALGGLTTVFWPLSPAILRLAPVGAILALVAWLLVVSRLRTSDVDDFVKLVVELTEHV